MKKKYDFIPNKLNKYSIRRFSVGTASILVGATLAFGLSKDAQADEVEHKNEVTRPKVEQAASQPNAGQKTEDKDQDAIQPSGEQKTETKDQEAVQSNESQDSEAKNQEPSQSSEEQDAEVENQEAAQSNAAQDAEAEDQDASQSNQPQDTEDKNQEASQSNATQDVEAKNQEASQPKVERKSVVNNQNTSQSNEEHETATNNQEAVQPKVEREAATNTSENDSDVSGENVNDKVKVDSFDFNETKIDPNQSGHTSLSASFKVDDSIKSGDYFTFDIPKNISIDGDIDYSNVNNQFNLPNLTNKNGDIIARGVYNTSTKQGTYTFTDFVNNKKISQENLKFQFGQTEKILQKAEHTL
ncbi:Ig-like domain-containing protein [Staphylococcus lloydii]|uniref:Ig-like domain-containing protein n=1 Tax=Staphylococcus lloydii TaxID=2781774 RepID=UPI0029291FAE|nr:Ig-like domain-containing protein [Staphylococcus lloydii]MDU9418620.1 Ig-like domain-containing protein [Staphylococcus lloydii]